MVSGWLDPTAQPFFEMSVTVAPPTRVPHSRSTGTLTGTREVLDVLGGGARLLGDLGPNLAGVALKGADDVGWAWAGLRG